LACTAEELKTVASGLGIDEVRAHLQTQIQNAGFIEKIMQTDKGLVVEGWAADPTAKSPAVAVHVFVAGEDVAVDSPNVPRSDVATALGAASNLFGFHLVAPARSKSARDVHVFAQLHDGSFAELLTLAPR
jgi:hypothetical protein